MFRRLFWGLIGVGLGAVVGVQTVRAINRTKQKYSPPNIAREAGGRLASLRERLAEAVGEGREEMRARELELRAELRLPPP